GDRGRGHVGRAGDLLLLEGVAHRRAAVHAHHDRRDAEGDQDRAGDHSADLEELSHRRLLPSRSLPLCACDLWPQSPAARARRHRWRAGFALRVFRYRTAEASSRAAMPRTTSTGRRASRRTPRETLPSRALAIVPWPREPTTIRSA